MLEVIGIFIGGAVILSVIGAFCGSFADENRRAREGRIIRKMMEDNDDLHGAQKAYRASKD